MKPFFQQTFAQLKGVVAITGGLNKPLSAAKPWNEHPIARTTKRLGRLGILAALSATAFTAPVALAQAATASSETRHVMEFASHPSEGADAIVVLTPDKDYDLHKPLKLKRYISGNMHSNERTFVAEGAITHAPETIIAPLKKGKPVKLFLRRYPDRNEYYITAIYPADFASEEAK